MVAVYRPGGVTTSLNEVDLTYANASSATDNTYGDISGAILQQVLVDESIPYVPSVANGQTVFTLPATPANAAAVRMFVNGVEYRSPDFTVSGVILAWTSSSFKLASTDRVEIYS
jgi:hypothetical protein